MPLIKSGKYDDEVTLDLAPEAVIARLLDVLEEQGADIEHPDPLAIRAEVASGIWNMNTAEVKIRVEPVGETRSRLVFDADAWEGVISQKTAQKAVTRIIAAI